VTRWAVILAGGVGSRFWPLSTPTRPKQLLPLVGDQPLLEQTTNRLRPLVPPERTLVMTNAVLAPAITELLPDLPDENLLIEPRPAGTGPALAWAAREIGARAGPDAVMISVHADWTVGDPERFLATLADAADTAERESALVTVGVVPTRPDPGFGYIQPGDTVNGARRVARFVEKPDVATAERFIADGFLWNSGIFVWRVRDLMREIEAHAPEIAPALRSAESADAFFRQVRPISIDHAVMERSAHALVLPGDFAWDDIGTWAALRRVRVADDAGNAVAGDVHAVASSGSVVHAESGTVVLYGVSDLVVVTRAGLTLVTTIDGAADLKTLLDALPSRVRERA
jgi:mannose-1-phosphate guanylyltransferase